MRTKIGLSISIRLLRSTCAHSPVTRLRRCFCRYCSLLLLLVLQPAGQELLASLPDADALESPGLPTSLPVEVRPLTEQQGSTSPSVSVLAGLPQYFIANAGQVAPQVRYYTKGSGQLMYFTDDGVHFVLRSVEDTTPAEAGKPPQHEADTKEPGLQPNLQTTSYKLQSAQLIFFGANPEKRVGR